MFGYHSERFMSFKSAENLNKLVQKPDCTLEELLDEDELVSELQNSNMKLINFFTPLKVFDLLKYVVEEAKIKINK